MDGNPNLNGVRDWSGSEVGAAEPVSNAGWSEQRLRGLKRQQSIKNAIHCSGIGLHSGRRVTMTLEPAPVDHGIVFAFESSPELAIPALWNGAIESPLCSTLEAVDGRRIGTIEHLMAALSALEIDNLKVVLSGDEVPIMDGSAAPFVFLIECAGIVEQAAPRRAVEILKPVTVEQPGRRATLLPAKRFEVGFEIDFEHPHVGRQTWSSAIDAGRFRQQIARARTFGFLEDVDVLRSKGLIKGGSLANSIVVSRDGVVNEEGLRFADELVRHKVLDAIGDLYLAGGPILGRFEGWRAGHSLTLVLLRTLFADESAWRWTHLPADERAGAVPAMKAVAASA